MSAKIETKMCFAPIFRKINHFENKYTIGFDASFITWNINKLKNINKPVCLNFKRYIYGSV